MKKWTEEELSFLVENYPIHGKEYCSKKLNRPEASIRAKASRLGLKVLDIGKNQRLNAFNKHLDLLKDSDYEFLDTFDNYTGNSAKLKHKHKVCGHIWRISPNNLFKLVGCPGCSKKGYKEFQKTFLYTAYFPALDLYKVGVTVNWDKRKSDFGYKVELVYIEVFETGKEAYLEEAILKERLKPFMYNSEELRNGNRETFIWPTN